jgi:hypothetical protein
LIPAWGSTFSCFSETVGEGGADRIHREPHLCDDHVHRSSRRGQRPHPLDQLRIAAAGEAARHNGEPPPCQRGRLIAAGGAAYLVSKAVKSARVLAFADLGMEAIHEFVVKDMPVTVAADGSGASIHEIGPSRQRRPVITRSGHAASARQSCAGYKAPDLPV